jgi:protein-S-isoprenylcysteine O-methyltransferase Ste14
MVRIQIKLEDRSWKGIITSFALKAIANEYFLLFAILFTLRNLAEIVIQPRNPAHLSFRNKQGILSLVILVGSFWVSGGATGYYLFVNPGRNFYAYCLGMILFVLGFIGRLIGLQTLGENYSQFLQAPPGDELVVSGVYVIIRHPLYAFYIVELIAFVLIRWNLISLLALGAVSVATIYRIKEEERILAQQFGKEFEAYCQATKRLIPFIY